jgi:hypothetical protein
MAKAQAATLRADLPWEMRLVGLLRLPPFAAGGALAAGICVLYLLEQWLHGFPVLAAPADSRFPYSAETHATVMSSVLFGFFVGAYRHSYVAISRELATVAPGARLAATGRGSTLVGLLFLAGLYLWLTQAAGGVSTGQLAVPLKNGVVTTVVAFLLSFAVVGRLAYFSLRGARQAADLAAGTVAIDLWNLDSLAGFGRIGLRLALVWIVGMTLFSVALLGDPNPEDVPVRWPMAAATLAMAAGVFVLPARGVQRRIRVAKREELARLDAALRRLREDGASAPPGTTADLLATRAYVEDVREWPFDTHTVTRFTLYLLLPLGSWLGGAFVERALSAVLDP